VKKAAVRRHDQPATVERFRQSEKIEEEIDCVDMNEICRSDVTQHTRRNGIALRPPIGDPNDFDAVDRLIALQARSA